MDGRGDSNVDTDTLKDKENLQIVLQANYLIIDCIRMFLFLKKDVKLKFNGLSMIIDLLF